MLGSTLQLFHFTARWSSDRFSPLKKQKILSIVFVVDTTYYYVLILSRIVESERTSAEDMLPVTTYSLRLIPVSPQGGRGDPLLA
jgi:hypothetical protein